MYHDIVSSFVGWFICFLGQWWLVYHNIVSSFVGWFICFLGQWWFSVS